MAKALIITEKPSVARDIVAALGGFDGSSKAGYWESERYVCTFAVGHLLELLAPEDINPAFKQWSLAHLPIVPERFALKPIKDNAERLDAIRSLAQRPDIDRLINACDAAREGELIFREIVAYLGLRLPIDRLWLQSMTPEAIRQSFERLRSGEQVKGLADAAACRAKSDWLIGMNATRAFSKRMSRPGDAGAWSVGRVQTPTLALLVERELAILGHEAKPFFQIKAKFEASDHSYEGVWFDPGLSQPAEHLRAQSAQQQPRKTAATSRETNPSADKRPRDDRISDRGRARATIGALTAGQPGQATEQRDHSRRHAPPPFELTALQKQMANRYKWTSKRTLEAAQRCYETHKVITYPRTGSHCLPSDYEPEVMRLLRRFAEHGPLSEHARYLLEHGLQNRDKIFDDAGVSDHFAIIPTGKRAELAGDDAKLYEAVVQRFVAAFFPPAIFDRVRRVTIVGGQHFRSGPSETLSVPGWMGVTGVPRKAADALPLLSNKTVKLLSTKLIEEQTKPPPRISEAGLLSLMEHAGRQVDDEDLKAALNHAEGLGTPATRADIIQNLKSKGYIDQELRPTFKGVQLIQTLQQIGVARLTSAELTARLELELAEVEAGQRPAAVFMTSIVEYISEVVAAAKSFNLDQLYQAHAPLGPCPQCSAGLVREQAWLYVCACGFRLSKDLGVRYLDRKTVTSLLANGKTAVIEGLVSSGPASSGREGKARPGALALRQGQVVLQIMDAAGGLIEQALQGVAPRPTTPTKSGRQPVGACPVHPQDCQVIETRGAWLCTTRLQQLQSGVSEPIGTFLPKLVCGRQLSVEDAKAFIESGATPELEGFQSRKGNRFAARIIMRPGGAWAFEFAPSPSKAAPQNST